jgi:shikimate kinase
MPDNPTFQIPKDVIEPILNAHINTAVAMALEGKDQIIESIVTRVLNQKVDSQGKPDNYGYNSSVAWIQWLMEDAVRKAVKQAIEEQVNVHKDAIKKAIAAEIGIKGKYSPLAKSLIEGMCSSLTHPDVLKYRINVTYGGK